MRHDVIEDVVSLVKPGSVHRRLYDDPAIFELELERVFGLGLDLCRPRKPGQKSWRLFLHLSRPQACRGGARPGR